MHTVTVGQVIDVSPTPELSGTVGAMTDELLHVAPPSVVLSTWLPTGLSDELEMPSATQQCWSSRHHTELKPYPEDGMATGAQLDPPSVVSMASPSSFPPTARQCPTSGHEMALSEAPPIAPVSDDHMPPPSVLVWRVVWPETV